jgi:hypothetical protein
VTRAILRTIATVGAGIGVAVAVLLYLAQSGTFGPNGSGGIGDLPTDWWLAFGVVGVGAGLLAALIVDAALGGPRTRRLPPDR